MTVTLGSGEHLLVKALEFESALRAQVSRDGRDPAAAEEMLQETYARILVAGDDPSFRVSCVRTFALGVLRDVMGDAETELPAATGGGSHEIEAASESEELARLATALGSLPRRTRQVFTLRKVYECSHSEIARRLGIPEEAVKAHLAHAAKECAQHFFPGARLAKRG
jgi:RNA polymerase sigma-70 factor (ECF subfamily)